MVFIAKSTEELPNYKISCYAVVIIFLGVLVPQVLIISLASIIEYLFGIDLLNSKLIIIFSNMVFWLGAILSYNYFICVPQTSKSLKFHFTLNHIKYYPVLIGMMTGAMMITDYLTSLIPISGSFWGKLFDAFTKMFNPFIDSPLSLILLSLVFAPIFEEVFFRGVVQKGLINRGISPKKAIIFASLCFGLLHLNPWQFLSAFILGIVIGYVYEKTGSLLNAILLHFYNNLINILFLFYGQETSKNLAVGQSIENPSIGYFALGIAILILFFYIFNKIHQRKN